MAKPTLATNKKPDRRGCPKGKGVTVGGPGAKDSGPRPKGRIGNPPFVPTGAQRARVLSLAAVAHPQPLIADELGISVDTLTRHFAKELAEGLPIANSRLGGVLYKRAMAGDIKAIEMWFDRRGGPEWKKKTMIEQSGPNGGPISHEVGIHPTAFSNLPIAKRRELEQLLIEAEAGFEDGSA